VGIAAELVHPVAHIFHTDTAIVQFSIEVLLLYQLLWWFQPRDFGLMACFYLRPAAIKMSKALLARRPCRKLVAAKEQLP
jgi:hypothetical protein